MDMISRPWWGWRRSSLRLFRKICANEHQQSPPHPNNYRVLFFGGDQHRRKSCRDPLHGAGPIPFPAVVVPKAKREGESALRLSLSYTKDTPSERYGAGRFYFCAYLTLNERYDVLKKEDVP